MISKKLRFKAVDGLLLVLVFALVAYVIHRIQDGLVYKSDWSVIPQFLFHQDPQTGWWVPNYLLQGFLATIKLSFWALIPAFALGLLVALWRTSRHLLPRMLGRTYVELIRNLPPLVLIFIFYFFIVDQIMPHLGLDSFLRSAPGWVNALVAFFFSEPSLFVQFLSGIATLSFFEGAYIAEIIRAGIVSVERGQMEASYSLGLSWVDEMRFVVLPQALKRQLPALCNEFVNTIKYSSIASVISIQETTFMGREVVATTGRIFEVWISVALLYLILTLSLSAAVGRLERRLRAGD